MSKLGVGIHVVLGSGYHKDSSWLNITHNYDGTEDRTRQQFIPVHFVALSKITRINVKYQLRFPIENVCM